MLFASITTSSITIWAFILPLMTFTSVTWDYWSKTVTRLTLIVGTLISHRLTTTNLSSSSSVKTGLTMSQSNLPLPHPTRGR